MIPKKWINSVEEPPWHAGHPVARQVAAQGHGDLLALERTEGDNGSTRTAQVAEAPLSSSVHGPRSMSDWAKLFGR
jgi:hypothetical protein